MKKIIKLICVILCMAVTSVYAESLFSDIDGHWAKETIEDLASRGIINGKDKGIYDPQGLVTRAEFCKLLVSIVGTTPVEKYDKFADVQKEDWYAEYVYSAFERGIVSTSDIENSQFLPNESADRETVAVWSARLLGLTSDDSNTPFADNDKISNKKAVSAAYQNGIVTGDEGTNTFRPADSLTRAEAAAIISRVLNKYGEYEPTAEICAFYNDKDGAYSMTFDDNSLESDVFYEKELQKRGYKGTAMLISGYLNNLSSWKQISKRGVLDFGNHGYGHLNYSTIGSDKEGDEQVRDDIVKGYETLKSYFPEQKVLVFAIPFGQNSARVQKYAAENHYASRGVGGSFNSPNTKNWMSLNTFTYTNQMKPSDLKAPLDEAKNQHSWLIALFHGCADQSTDTYTIPKKDFIEHLDDVKKFENDLWIASMTDVTAYLKERQEATVAIEQKTENELEVTLTDTLPDDLFDHPLTLKVRVPDEWSGKVTYSQDKKTENTDIITIDSKAYVLVNVLPDKGEIIITANEQ